MEQDGAINGLYGTQQKSLLDRALDNLAWIAAEKRLKKRGRVDDGICCSECYHNDVLCDCEFPCTRCIRYGIAHLCCYEHRESNSAMKRTKSQHSNFVVEDTGAPSPFMPLGFKNNTIKPRYDGHEHNRPQSHESWASPTDGHLNNRNDGPMYQGGSWPPTQVPNGPTLSLNHDSDNLQPSAYYGNSGDNGLHDLLLEEDPNSQARSPWLNYPSYNFVDSPKLHISDPYVDSPGIGLAAAKDIVDPPYLHISDPYVDSPGIGLAAAKDIVDPSRIQQQAAVRPSRVSPPLDDVKIPLHAPQSDSHGYCLIAYLDRGGYGLVTSVIHRDNPSLSFARKQIPKALIDYQDLKNEVQLIIQAKHRHVIRIVEEYQDDKNFYIVMEPVASSNLHQYLQEMTRNGSQIEWSMFGDRRLQLFRFMRCLATTVKDVHSRNIRHRDIKPHNILIKDQVIILTDFGTSFVSEEATRVGYTKTFGTDKYEPPEAFQKQKGGPSRALKTRTGRLGDIFSLGCTFYEMLEALSIQANFPQVNDNYAAHIDDKAFVNEARAVKEHKTLVSRRLEEEHRLPGLVEKMLKLVMNHMMVSVEERKDAAFVLNAVNEIYDEYDELQTGCCVDTDISDSESQMGSAGG